MFNTLNIGPSLLEQQLLLNPLVMKTPMPAFRCASDTGPALNNYDNRTMGPAPNGGEYCALVQDSNGASHQIALSNYVAVANPGDSTTPPVDPTIYGRPLGVAYQNSNINFRDITDGTSNQLLVGERAYKYKNLVMGAGTVLGHSSLTVTQSTSYSVKGSGLNVLGITYDGINATVNGSHSGHRGFSSNHVGGCHFALADGSVRFISENIDARKGTVSVAPYPSDIVTNTFGRLAARDDGNVVGEF